MILSFLTERLQGMVRLAVPLGFLALLLGLHVVGFVLPYVGTVRAPVFLIGLYYWAIYRPVLLPPWLVFVCGAAIDIIGNFPLGLNMLVLVLVRWIITDQRRFLMAQTFAMLWVSYAVVALSHMLLQWSLLSLLTLSFAPVTQAALSTMLSIILFPPVYLLLLGTHRFLPSARIGLRQKVQP
ncbi:MAG: rod shape-determining protein MreD [Alphaproteobacteria bacterium]|nr:rod shape-determining protein MreD [Alphaproteobacteria bacterium]